jgi:hypothetical protein
MPFVHLINNHLPIPSCEREYHPLEDYFTCSIAPGGIYSAWPSSSPAHPFRPGPPASNSITVFTGNRIILIAIQLSLLLLVTAIYLLCAFCCRTIRPFDAAILGMNVPRRYRSENRPLWQLRHWAKRQWDKLKLRNPILLETKDSTGKVTVRPLTLNDL